MRAFLVIALGLLAWPTFAATPTVEAFRGTNEVLVSSNVLDNRIIIGPATRISITASNAAQTIANAASNALFSIFSANNLITSNGAVSFTLTTSNSLVSQYLNADITTSNGAISFAMTVSNAVASLAGESNYNGEISVTNSSRFGWVNGKSGITNLLRSFQPAYGLKGTNEGGTNISLAIDPSIVVQQSDLTSASNALVSLLIANDTLTSNGAVSFTLTTSNSLQTSFLASDITTSNGAIAFSMTVSNALRSTFIANDTTTSNGLVTLLIANDTTTSNGLVTLLVANDTTTSNALNTAIIAATNSASVTNWINFRQSASEVLSNIVGMASFYWTNSQASSMVLSNIVGMASLYWTNGQASAMLLSNLVNNPYVAYTNVLTKTATTVSGAGNGNTNYLLTLSTNSVNYFYLGSSNVNIYTIGGSTLGSPILWTAIVTNLSANTWGFGTSSGTNRWKWFHYAYGTNRPAVLTNNTALCLQGQSDGTNTLVSYYYFAPGL